MYVLENNSTFIRSFLIFFIGCGIGALAFIFFKAESYFMSMISLLFGGCLLLFGMKLMIKPVESKLVISNHSVMVESGALLKEYDKASVFGMGYTTCSEDERFFIILNDGVMFELPKALVSGKEERLINDIKNKQVIDLYPLNFSSLKKTFKSSPPRVDLNHLNELLRQP